jgi:hypothetical protein
MKIGWKAKINFRSIQAFCLKKVSRRKCKKQEEGKISLGQFLVD